MVVVPTATTRRPSARARLTASAVSPGIATSSARIRWTSTRAVRTGRNVPIPTCRVSGWTSIPLARRRASSAVVKCKPAVGAAIEPSSRAYTVW